MQTYELGIYDMSGNVWKWRQDCKGSYCISSHVNPQVLIVGHTVCSVGVVDSTLPGSVARLTVAADHLTTATTVLGFVWSSPSNDFLVFELSALFIKILSR
ncbi:hypothetical protein [Prevotella sp.]|uniref:hypothetical protein n=1 Tax=Prevotella sp. TaxID=59823 RepID=UPI0040250547